MTSILVPTTLWLLMFSLGNALWTAGVDAARRDEWLKRFFWKHWWHFPILTIIEFIVFNLLFWNLWRIRPSLYPSTNLTDIRGLLLAIEEALMFSGFIAFFPFGIIWHFWQLGRR